ncbi:MAG: thiamine-phosphate kinase [Pseudomonadota bacterium]
MPRSGEFDWIARHFAPLVKEGSFGLLDDAAVWMPDVGCSVAVTADTIVEGIHFFTDDAPDLIAQKAVRVNASDLSAKGVASQAMMLSLGVPDRWNDDDVERFACGLRDDLTSSGIVLLGGDTTRSPERLTIAVTMFGSCNLDRYISRLGAKPGEFVSVCGLIGDAVLGLKIRTGELKASGRDSDALTRRQAVPPETWRTAPIVGQGASAAMDVSDGLIGDLAKLCNASGVSADIDLADMPISDAAKRTVKCGDPSILTAMATGGDDYVILLTAPQDRKADLIAAAKACKAELTIIGSIQASGSGGESAVRVSHRGVPVEVAEASYQHR